MPIDLLDLPMPVTLRPAAPLSDEQLLRLSLRNKGWKIERNREGELTFMTPVTGKGGKHEMYVTRIFANWSEEDGSGLAFGSNTGFNLPDGSCLSPDAAWIPLERWNALTPGQQDSFLPFCPDFLMEVRSKSDGRRALEDKMQLWMQNGAKLAWLVDPIDRSVTIYRPGQAPRTLDQPEEVTAEAPVAGFRLPCAPLWR